MKYKLNLINLVIVETNAKTLRGLFDEDRLAQVPEIAELVKSGKAGRPLDAIELVIAESGEILKHSRELKKFIQIDNWR